MEEMECVEEWEVDEEDWEWGEVWRQQEWDNEWEKCNMIWHDDMILTGEEYDRVTLTE